MKIDRGEVTPQQLLSNALFAVKGMKRLVIVGEYDDGRKFTGWSAGELLAHVGLLELAKTDMLGKLTAVENPDGN